MIKRSKNLWIGVWFVVFPLIVGGFVYWLARPIDQTPFLQWLNVPVPPFDLAAFVPKRWLDPLPSFVWVFSMTAALWLIFQPNSDKAATGLGVASFLFAFLYELFQWKNIIAGSFDPLDVGCSLLAVVLVLLFLKNW